MVLFLLLVGNITIICSKKIKLIKLKPFSVTQLFLTFSNVTVKSKVKHIYFKGHSLNSLLKVQLR